MYKIEFNDKMTVEDILESFKRLKETDTNSYIDIDCIIIYHDDVNLEEKVRMAYDMYHRKHSVSKREKAVNDEIENVSKNIIDLITLSNNEKFLFQLGNVLEHTKEEYKKAVFEFYTKVYGITSQEEANEEMMNLEYISSLLLILSSDYNKSQKRFQIQQVINTMCVNGDEDRKFNDAVRQIGYYTEYEDEIKELLYTGLLDESIEEKNKLLERIKKREQQ